jgi:hypothetical protein
MGIRQWLPPVSAGRLRNLREVAPMFQLGISDTRRQIRNAAGGAFSTR